MLYIPKNTKFAKFQKKKIKQAQSKILELNYGSFGLKSKDNFYLTSGQLEMIKLNLAKGTKKVGRYWIRVFSHVPVTAKPLEVRMGKGKGYVDRWVCKITRGTIICELSGISEKQANGLFKKISLKLPIKTTFFTKT